jgi:hypothetical protein
MSISHVWVEAIERSESPGTERWAVGVIVEDACHQVAGFPHPHELPAWILEGPVGRPETRYHPAALMASASSSTRREPSR